MSVPDVKTKVCLVVIDGWGVAPHDKFNAITNADTSCMTDLKENALYSDILAHGTAVGLPDGVMGNSEVGHLTIGAGRVNYQDLERINFSIADGTFYKNPVLLEMFENAKAKTGRVHFLGLVSDGGVHAHIDHLKEFIRAAKDNDVPECYVHFFADGRDTPPRSAAKYLDDLLAYMNSINYGKVASICGRYFAMDRDKRWDRVQLAYDAIVESKNAEIVADHDALIAAIQAKYARDETDEFFKPVVVSHETKHDISSATGTSIVGSNIVDNDTLCFIDFRADRMREIALTLGMGSTPFEKIVDGKSDTTHRSGLHVVQMTRYDSKYTMPVLYSPNDMRDGLAEWISKQGLTQFHTAETEKYAHVTFFFNGGVEAAFPGEDRGMVQSPSVSTYDLKPEMNAAGVADSVVEALNKNKYPFVMCNFAPPDMVGHTGVMDAAVHACTATDKAIAEIKAGCDANGYSLVITADHGNAEQMVDFTTGNPHTAHTSNPVPFIIHLDKDYPNREQLKMTPGGGVKDVAPTILSLMGLSIPEAMTGHNLVQ